MTAGDHDPVILGLANLFLNGEQDTNCVGKEEETPMKTVPNITTAADSLNLLSAGVQMLRRYVKEVRVKREQARLEEEVRLAASAKAAADFAFTCGSRDPAAILQRLPASIRAFNTQIAAITATTVHKATAADDPTAYEHPCPGDLGRVVRALHFPDPDRPCRQLLSTGKCAQGDVCLHLHANTSTFEMISYVENATKNVDVCIRKSGKMDERKYVDGVTQDLAQRKADFLLKIANVRKVLVELELDGAVLSYSHNFAWLTGGARSFINMAVDVGVGSIYVDASQVVLLTNEIEGHRLIHEELNGLQDEIKLHEYPWYAQQSASDLAKMLAKSERIAVDTTDAQFSEHISKLRVTLTEHEMALFRSLGKDCGRIIAEVARAVRPSMTEFEIAAQLSQKSWAAGITPIVLLIAADERVDAIRHPLPTPKRVKNKVMLVLCGRRAGFVLSVTRIVYVTTTPNATIPADLLRRHEAATYVDALVIAKTIPGAVANDLFKEIQNAYSEKGFDGEWKLHHQGGCAGYQSREWIANPELQRVVGKNQAYAWNPSITGTKSEDTVLIQQSASGEVTREVLSASPNWPMIEHTIDGVTVARPGILHLAF